MRRSDQRAGINRNLDVNRSKNKSYTNIFSSKRNPVSYIKDDRPELHSRFI
jgi:hypothetical protein